MQLINLPTSRPLHSAKHSSRIQSPSRALDISLLPSVAFRMIDRSTYLPHGQLYYLAAASHTIGQSTCLPRNLYTTTLHSTRNYYFFYRSEERRVGKECRTR